MNGLRSVIEGRTSVTESRRLLSFGLKCCGLCRTVKNLDDFFKNKSLPGGRKKICKDCNRIHDRRRSRASVHRNGKATRRRLKIDVVYRYGGLCACCGESRIEFLVIDHENGGGNKHRRSISPNGRGTCFYRWLRKNGYPKGFRVLCQNCNSSLGHYGYCPHQNSPIASQ